MQAHPQSSPAARIHSTSRPAPNPLLHDAQPGANSQPSSRVRLRGKLPAPAASPAQSLAQSAGLAHDAGNLLAGLGLYCDLLSAPGVLRPEHQHYATELSLISNRSADLIRRLIAAPPVDVPTAGDPATKLASPRNSTADPQPQAPEVFVRRSRRSTDRGPVAADDTFGLIALAPVLQGIATEAATVTVHCGGSLPATHLPHELIERIVVNLVRNAAEAIRLQRSRTPAADLPRPSEILVSMAVVSGRLQLTVEDNGPGMPPAVAAAFLQPSALPRGASRGLGHRIVHELATGSAAQLSIRVRPGRGTLFCLRWPLPPASTAGQPPFALPPTLSVNSPYEEPSRVNTQNLRQDLRQDLC